MEDDWEYLFDLCGYIVIRGVMTPEDVAEANAAVDRHQYELRDNTQHAKGTAFAKQRGEAELAVAAPRRKDLRHMLGASRSSPVRENARTRVARSVPERDLWPRLSNGPRPDSDYTRKRLTKWQPSRQQWPGL